MSFQNLDIALRLASQQYDAGMAKAQMKMAAFKAELGEVSAASDRDFSKVSHAALLMGTGLAAAFAYTANTFAKFDQGMSAVQAASGATSGEMMALEKAALAAGQATSFSATEAARAQEELAKAGVSTADILGGALMGSMHLAEAGAIDLARASELAAGAMNTFHLKGSDVEHVADVYAAAANKSAAGVEDMGQAMSQTGLVAAQLGIGLEDTAGTLAAFAQAGLKGSDAGTSMKTMLQSFVPRSKEAAETMRSLGLTFFDASGNFVGLGNAAEQLHTKLEPLTQEARFDALNQIFGSDAIRGAAILANEGAAGIGKWTTAVNDSGYAAEIARIRMDNLKGDIEQLGGAFETMLIGQGEKADGVLRSLVQTSTDMVNGFSAMPSSVQTGAVAVEGLGGAALLTVGAVGTLLPKWREFQEYAKHMGRIGTVASAGIKGIAGAAIGAAVPLVLWSAHLGDVEEKATKMAKAVTADMKPPKTYQEYAAQVNKVGEAYNRLTDAALAGESQFTRGSTRVWEMIDLWSQKTVTVSGEAADKLRAQLGAMTPGLEHWSETTKRVGQETGLTADQVAVLAQKAGIDLRGSAIAIQEQLGLTTEQMAALKAQGIDFGGSIDEDVKALTTFYGTLGNADPATAGMKISLKGMADGAKSAEERFRDFTNLVDQWVARAIGPKQAMDAFMGDLNRVGEAADAVRAKAGGVFSGFSNEAIAFRGVMNSLVQDAAGLVKQWADGKITAAEMQTGLDNLGLALLIAGDRARVPRDVTNEYLGIIKSLPAQAGTAVSAPGAVESKDAVGDVNAELDRAAQGAHGTVTMDVSEAAAAVRGIWDNNLPPGTAEFAGFSGRAHVTPLSTGGRATGGPVSAGRMYEVNERGTPELLTVGRKQMLMMGPESGEVTPMDPSALGRWSVPSGGTWTGQGDGRDLAGMDSTQRTDFADKWQHAVGWGADPKSKDWWNQLRGSWATSGWVGTGKAPAALAHLMGGPGSTPTGWNTTAAPARPGGGWSNSSGGGVHVGAITVNAPNYIGDQRQLGDAVMAALEPKLHELARAVSIREAGIKGAG